MSRSDLLKKTTALALTLALTGATPGFEFYRAVAGPIAAPGNSVTPGAPGAAPVFLPGVTGLTGTPAGGPAAVFDAGRALQGGLKGLPVLPGRSGVPTAVQGPLPGEAVLPSQESFGTQVDSARILTPEEAIRQLSPALSEEGTTPVQRAEQAIRGLEALTLDVPDFSRAGVMGSSALAASDFHRRTRQAFAPAGSGDVAVHVPDSRPLASGVKQSKGQGKSARKMPERPEDLEENGGRHESRVPDPDGSLHPRRQDDGPDSISDEPSRGGSGPVLFSLALGLLLLPAAAFGAPVPGLAVVPNMLLAGGAAWLGIVMPAAVLHEYAHGLVATLFGDPTPRQHGRLSLNPFRHVDAVTTVALPLAIPLLGSLFGMNLPPIGMAKEMPITPSNFKHERLGRLLTALAGPAVNFAFAAAAAAAIPLVANPMGVFALYMAAQVNLVLGMFNLLPVPTFDGGGALRAFLTGSFARAYDSVESYLSDPRHRWLKLGLVVAAAVPAAPLLVHLSGAITSWLVMDLFAVETAAAVRQAASALPALAAAGMALSMRMLPDAGILRASREITLRAGGPALAATLKDAMDSGADKVKILVETPAGVQWTEDYHVDYVDWSRPTALEDFQVSIQGMMVQLDRAGLSPELLQEFGASPVANYRLINTATLAVPAARREGLEARLRSLGFTVKENRRIGIVPPVDPQSEKGNAAAKDVTLREVVEITGAVKVQAELKKELGGAIDASMLRVPSLAKGLTMRLLERLGVLRKPANPAGSIIDTGNDPDHPMLKGRYVRNGKDGHGHGTWVGSAVTSFDPEQKNLRSYNTFSNGSATTDDILRDLTLADNEGAEWFTNSWGDSWGDPDASEAKLVREIAKQGKIQFFAAGNQGDGENTVGGPAIAYYQDPKTGVMTIVSVGATDSELVTAWFQSRGPHSPMVAENKAKFPGYPNRVDIQSVGHRVYGAYPTYMKGADRTDPVLGPQKKSSGTSMSTPTLGGAYSLLREFGFSPVAVVKAMFESAKDTGKSAADGGKGFLDVWAAYQLLKKAQEGTPMGRVLGLLRSAAVRVLVRPQPAAVVKDRLNLGALTAPAIEARPPANKRELRILKGHTDSIHTGFFSPRGTKVATIGGDAVRIWETQSGKILSVLKVDKNAFISATFSPDESKVLTVNRGTLEIWATESGKLLHRLILDDGTRLAFFSLDGEKVIAVGSNVRFFDVKSGKLLSVFKQDHGVGKAFLNADGTKVILVRDDLMDKYSEVTILDLKSESQFLYFDGAHSISMSADGERALLRYNHKAEVWDMENKNILSKLEHKNWFHRLFDPLFGINTEGDYLYSAFLSADGTKAVTASADGTARGWEADSGRPLYIIKNKGGVYSSAFDPDGSMILTAGDDGIGRVASAKNGKILHVFKGHEGWISYAFFSPDGRTALTMAGEHIRDTTAILWDVVSGKIILKAQGGRDMLGSVPLTPDNKERVLPPAPLSGLWKVSTVLRSYIPMSYASISPDGEKLLVIGDKTARIWDIDLK